ncbi:glutamine amidotransferase [Mesorhizobium sp. M1338]
MLFANHGRGRTVAWATDIGPHWLSQDFLEWPLYGNLMCEHGAVASPAPNEKGGYLVSAVAGFAAGLNSAFN